MELGALHRTDASLPQMVCDVGTGQERTDVCRQGDISRIWRLQFNKRDLQEKK